MDAVAERVAPIDLSGQPGKSPGCNAAGEEILHPVPGHAGDSLRAFDIQRSQITASELFAMFDVYPIRNLMLIQFQLFQRNRVTFIQSSPFECCRQSPPVRFFRTWLLQFNPHSGQLRNIGLPNQLRFGLQACICRQPLRQWQCILRKPEEVTVPAACVQAGLSRSLSSWS